MTKGKNKMNQNNVMVMSFGKYKDKPINKLPSDYIAWCLKDASVIERNTDLKMALEDELITRLINIPVGDRSPAINTFVTAYDKHAMAADVKDPEFERIVVDKLYEFIHEVVKH